MQTEEESTNPSANTVSGLPPISSPQPSSVSEATATVTPTRGATISAIEQMSSPRMKVTYNHSQAVMTIEEGSELNGLSDDYAKEKDIILKPSSRNATAAGSNRLDIVPE